MSISNIPRRAVTEESRPRFADSARLIAALFRAGHLAPVIDSVHASSVAADAWRRLEAAGFLTEEAIVSAEDDALRQCGLSRQKLRYAKALAHARLDYAALRDMADDDVTATLVALPGIGRWTAEVYVMLSLGRADVFAPGDLALQEAARHLFALEERPSERDLRKMAEDWSPWRAVAARLLWAYYRVIKNREGI